MKLCPTCKSTYPDDANFCPQETCATPNGPQRLQMLAAEPKASPAAAQGGRFQLGPRIGGRSTGEVYRATDGQTGASVAYKIVGADVLPNPTAFARAEREIKQLMRVQSPRIAAVVDSGRTADDRLFLALELCEGESLESLLRRGPLPLDRARAIVGQVGQALLEAQKAGIVHRDVAPKNVLVGPSGDVKVINFAIAKPVNDKAAGVPAYLSPEQVQGKPVDQRSNTYSLAALLYHMLTGEPPFQGAPEAVLELHVSSPPLAPSQRRPEANLTPEVDRVLLKALSKSSSSRHLTLRLFLSEVEALNVAAAQAPAAAAGGKEAGVGFAKTMLFAGGQAEVANLVAKAIASRGGGPAAGAPAAAAAAAPEAPPAAPPPAAMPVAAPPVAPAAAPVAAAPVAAAPVAAAPPPAAAPQPAAPMAFAAPPAAEQRLGTAATMAAIPAPVMPAAAPMTNGAEGADHNDRVARLTPPPVTPFPPPGAAAPAAASFVSAQAAAAKPPAADAGKGAGGGKGAAFRETLWFKKGDVEHMIAEAKAKMAGNGKPGEEVPGEDIKPIEDRYVDDGSVTADDRKKFSLRTGGTATSLPAVGGVVPGEAMSDQDVIREVSGTRKTVITVVAVVIVLAIAAVAVTMMRGKSAPPAAAPAAAAPAVPAPAAAAVAPEPAAKPPEPPKPAEPDKPALAQAKAEKAEKKSEPDKKSSRRKADKKKRR